jgi:hypothetical protein
MIGIYLVAEELLASQGLGSMELVGWLVEPWQ